MRNRRKVSSHHYLEDTFVNLTPLIDVVFVVLIAFIVIAPLLEVDRISLAQANQKSEKDISQKGQIQIYVKEDDTIWINHRLVSDTELFTVLDQIKKKFPHQVPQLFHDKNARFGTYQIVKNTVEKIGFEQMDVILKSK